MSKKGFIFKTDIKGWKNVVKQLQKIKGGTYKDILRAECAEILSITARRKSTKLADKTKIVGRHSIVDVYFLGYVGKKEAYTLKEGEGGVTKQTTYYLRHRIPTKVWNYILPKTKKRTQKHFGNYGLNKGQFYLMSKILNLKSPPKGFPDEAKRFLGLRGNTIRHKVFTKEFGKNDRKYGIELESRLSKVISYGNGAKNFKSVMRSRVKKFETALAKGVMKDIKKRTKQYPLVFSN